MIFLILEFSTCRGLLISTDSLTKHSALIILCRVASSQIGLLDAFSMSVSQCEELRNDVARLSATRAKHNMDVSREAPSGRLKQGHNAWLGRALRDL